MDVLVERYQRRKYVNQEDAPMLYYIRQKAGNVRVMDVDTMAAAIESIPLKHLWSSCGCRLLRAIK